MLLKKNKLSALVALFGGMAGATTFISPQALAQDDEVVEEVVVTGFRKSLEAALNIKRESANNVDSIVAEDIGKMPDLNLAESIQRVPGVAITREGGEGRQITVRGLGPTYTRVTLNGMEVPASAGGLDSSGGVNRGRSFDFNIFSADLFRRININKNSVAHIEEGGLASTVELYTLRPLERAGFNANAGLQSSYNVHTGEIDPRLTGMISNTFADDRYGFVLGFNFSQRTVHQEGFGSVRWSGPASDFQGDSDAHNHGWADTSNTVVNGTPNPAAHYPDYAEIQAEHPELVPLDYMWTPRLPRTDSFNQDQERTGILAGFQARPTDRLELNLNVMTSRRDADVFSYNHNTQFRSNYNNITPVEVTLDPTGRYIVEGTFSGAKPRSESRGQFTSSDFSQVVASGRYDFNETMSLDVMFGNATSEHEGTAYRYNLTTIDPQDFTYSFVANSNVAELSYGHDILDYSLYEFTGPDHRIDIVKRDNTTFKVDFSWAFGDEGSNLLAGFISNEREIDSYHSRLPGGNYVSSPPAVTADNTRLFSEVVDNFGDGIGSPAGFPTNWVVTDISAAIQDYGAGVWVDDPARASTNYIVNEDTIGYYVESNYFVGDWRLNGGLRFVETTVKGNKSSLEESYDNVLPAINIVYEPFEDVLFRAAYSENLARPNPSNLSGAVNFTTVNGNISVDNPGLKPEMSENLDFGVEWYFAEESFVGLTLFNKKISDSIDSETTEGVTLSPELQAIVLLDDSYNPNSASYEPSAISPTSSGWNFTTTVNSPEEIEIQGIELAFNYVLPNGIGFLANYTHIDTDSSFTGLSDNSYNFGAFYEVDKYAARILVNYRDDYITDFTGSNGNQEHGTTGPTRVDFSGSYNLNEMFDLTLEVINVTNEKERLFTTGPAGDLDLMREYHTTGTEVIFGVRATF